MKRKEKQTLVSMDPADMAKHIQKLEDSLASLARTRYTKPSKNVREAKKLRYTIALVKTALRQKELVHVS